MPPKSPDVYTPPAEAPQSDEEAISAGWDPNDLEDTPAEALARAQAEEAEIPFLNWGEAYAKAESGEGGLRLIEVDGEKEVALQPGWEWVDKRVGAKNFAVKRISTPEVTPPVEVPIREMPEPELEPEPAPKPAKKAETRESAPRLTRKEREKMLKESLSGFYGRKIDLRSGSLDFTYTDEAGKEIACRLTGKGIYIGKEFLPLTATPQGLSVIATIPKDKPVVGGEKVKINMKEGEVTHIQVTPRGIIPVGLRVKGKMEEGKISRILSSSLAQGIATTELGKYGLTPRFHGGGSVSMDVNISAKTVPQSAYLNFADLFNVVENRGGILADASFNNDAIDPSGVAKANGNFNLAIG